MNRALWLKMDCDTAVSETDGNIMNKKFWGLEQQPEDYELWKCCIRLQVQSRKKG
jgi:hypothetical protein